MFQERLNDQGIRQDGRYTSSLNPFHATVTYKMPNCTCYCYGRVWEITGVEPKGLSLKNAKYWYNESVGFERGTEPKVGAVMCFDGTTGHVAIVEKVKENGDVVISQSNFGGEFFYVVTLKKSANYNNYFTNVKFMGFLYTYQEPVPKETFKIKYRGHIENEGWNDFKKDGETCGTTGQSKRLEAIQIDSNMEIYAKAHIQDIGWVDYGKISKDTVIGTTGESKRLEALCLKGNFKYRVHIEDTGWTQWTVADGIVTLGTVGMSQRIEAIEIIAL